MTELFYQWSPGSPLPECDPEELVERLEMILTRLRRGDVDDADMLLVRLMQEAQTCLIS